MTALPCHPCALQSPQHHTSLFTKSRFACHAAAVLLVARIRIEEVFSGTIGHPQVNNLGERGEEGESRGRKRKQLQFLPSYISLTLQEHTEHLSSFRVHTWPLRFSPPSCGQSPEQEGPAGQRQSKPPAKLTQAESFQQVCVLKAHSSMSAIKKVQSFRIELIIRK